MWEKYKTMLYEIGKNKNNKQYKLSWSLKITILKLYTVATIHFPYYKIINLYFASIVKIIPIGS